MGILDIFYNEIVNEAANGRVDAYFIYNTLFSTNIVDKEVIEAGVEYDNLMIPTLMIKDKDEFDKLLV